MSSPHNFTFTNNCPLSTAHSKSTLNSTGSSVAGSPMMDDDSRVIAEFQMEFRLGEGAYGTVYAATHSRSRKKFAIKVVPRSYVKSVEKQIIQEAVIMQGLRNKHVVQFIKLLRTRDHLYFVMDLAEGGELFDLIIQSKHFDESTARKFFQQLMSALVYCRKQNVVHRDLKAENLLLDKNGSLLVCDFGFSHKILPVPEDEDNSENDGYSVLPMGTLHYVSPEAASGNRAVNPFEQDLWAASVILYFMLSGQLPFEGRDEEETLYLISKCQPKIDNLPSSEASRIFMSRLLKQDPDDRLSMEDILRDPWFLKDLDPTLFPDDDEDRDSSEHSDSSVVPRNLSMRSNEGLSVRRQSSRLFLDFSHSPCESVSPTIDEESIIRRAFKAIGTDGYEDRFSIDELRDALILLKKDAVDSEEVRSLIHIITPTGKDSVTFTEFRNAWIERDLAHAKHRDCQFFQLFKLASLSHTDCEAGIVRELREAFNSVDDMHTGVITFPQWKRIFERVNIDVRDDELHGLLQYWNESIGGSESISFEDFVGGIVKRDILLKHPLGKKLACATNLAGFAQLRSLDKTEKTGFLVLGMREIIADKLILYSERLQLVTRNQRQSDSVLSFRYVREGAPQACCHSPHSSGKLGDGDSPSLNSRRLPPSSTRATLSPQQSHANSPSKGGNSCAICSCQLDVILSPTACIGYTLVKMRRITGLTADFHDSVQFLSAALEREREQANIDCCAVGDSELM